MVSFISSTGYDHALRNIDYVLPSSMPRFQVRTVFYGCTAA
jgi:hypothetical protein